MKMNQLGSWRFPKSLMPDLFPEDIHFIQRRVNQYPTWKRMSGANWGRSMNISPFTCEISLSSLISSTHPHPTLCWAWWIIVQCGSFSPGNKLLVSLCEKVFVKQSRGVGKSRVWLLYSFQMLLLVSAPAFLLTWYLLLWGLFRDSRQSWSVLISNPSAVHFQDCICSVSSNWAPSVFHDTQMCFPHSSLITHSPDEK